MPLPALAAVLARAAPLLARAGASGGAQLTKAGTTAAEAVVEAKAAKGGMDMSLLSNPAAYVQGGPSPGNPGSNAPPANPFAELEAPTARVSGFMEQLSGRLPQLSEGFGGLYKSITENIDRLRQWTDGLHSSNMQFAEFSASMSAVQAQAEVREYQLKREQGDRRAGTAGFLAEQKGNLDKSLAPIENLWAKFENVVGGSLLFLLEKLLTPVTVIAEWLDDKTSGGEGDDTLTMTDVLNELGKSEQEARNRRPARLR